MIRERNPLDVFTERETFANGDGRDPIPRSYRFSLPERPRPVREGFFLVGDVWFNRQTCPDDPAIIAAAEAMYFSPELDGFEFRGYAVSNFEMLLLRKIQYVSHAAILSILNLELERYLQDVERISHDGRTDSCDQEDASAISE